MNRWIIIALAVGGALFLCCGGTLVVALVAGEAGGGESAAARSVRSGCSDSIGGWHQTIAEGGLVLTRAGITAELPWAFKLTPAQLQGDLDLTILQVVVGARYELGQLVRGQYGEPRIAGRATERASGKTVFLAFSGGAMSGVAAPAVVFADDENVIQTQFPTSRELGALADLNRFSLSCADVEGRWTSGFHTAAERYAAGTGEYLGAEAVAAWRELTLESGSYQRESSAYVNRQFSKRTDSGSWSHDDWTLTLEPDGAEPMAFNAALVAVQRGFLLRLQSQKFTGDIEEFQRVE